MRRRGKNLMKPIIIINFKTYKSGKDVLKLAKYIEKFDRNTIVGVPATNIKEVSSKTKLKVYAEHVDAFSPGRNTGFILPEEIKKDGAVGTFLNHSEHKLNFKILKKSVLICKKVKLKTAVFASSLHEAKKISKLRPDFLIYEPPELVAGKVSVSSAKPEIIKKMSNSLKRNFLVGAGVHNKKDVDAALKLGASGFAVSSSVVLAKNPEKKLEEIFK